MRFTLSLTFVLASAAFASDRVVAQQSQSASDGIYNVAQARRGAPLYQDVCAMCHGLDMAGTELAPPLNKELFSKKWRNRTAAALLDYMQRQMPLNSPGGLSRQQSADILGLMLERAGFPAGKGELAADDAALSLVKFGDPKP